MITSTDFWERTNNLIKVRNTTQQALSEDCGFSPRRIQNLSSGNRYPDALEVVKIAQHLNTTVEYLVTGKLPEQDNRLKELQKEIEKLYRISESL